MKSISLDERIEGCLLGAAIGAELAFARHVFPERYVVKTPADAFQLTLEPVKNYAGRANRETALSLVPFAALGVRAYVKKKGRVTPEDFGALLRDDAAIASPAFAWDGVHTVQELLKEGTNPRLSGLGNAPCGLVAAAMPAVGIYHFADPEYAYLDGVELSSVVQPRPGADWAALCAAAVAEALAPNASPESIANTVLRLALENNKEVFYQLNAPLRAVDGILGVSDEQFAQWYHTEGSRIEPRAQTNWVAYNPLRTALPLVKRYAALPEKLMAMLLTSPVWSWYISMAGHNAVPAVIAGALVGALNGPKAFPASWLRWARRIVRPWLSIRRVVHTRLETERTVISVAEKLRGKADITRSTLFDKVYGCMLAGAIGNAMGSPVEGSMYWGIDERYPDGIKTILRPERLEGEDDNQMAMKLVETYLARHGRPVLARHFGAIWRESLNRDHFFVLCMGNAYDLICQGWDPHITGHWSVVTGSTVMCMEPVGVYHFADPEFAAIDATAVSYMYQRGLDVLAATMLATTVAEAFRPEATVDSVCEAALRVAPRTPFKTFDRRPFRSPYDYLSRCLEIADRYDDVLRVRPELYKKCLLYHMIDPLELWGFSLAMFKVARGDVRQAAIGGTNVGRDSDTIAGRAAMLSGTLRGARSVPKDWIAMFKPHVLARIRRNAERFARLVGYSRVERLRVRQESAKG